MRSSRTSRALAALVASLCLGCSKRGTNADEPKPAVTVDLSAEEANVSYVKEGLRDWYAWFMKGVYLQNEGKFRESLYCFNRAQAAWEKAYQSGATDKAEATDTLLQKAYLYLRLKEPAWALRYADRYENYVPGTALSADVRALAEYSLGDVKGSVREAQRVGGLTKGIIEGLALARKDDPLKGNDAVIAAWTGFLTKHFQYPSPLSSEHKTVAELTWATFPEDAQRILTDARLSPASL